MGHLEAYLKQKNNRNTQKRQKEKPPNRCRSFVLQQNTMGYLVPPPHLWRHIVQGSYLKPGNGATTGTFLNGVIPGNPESHASNVLVYDHFPYFKCDCGIKHPDANHGAGI